MGAEKSPFFRAVDGVTAAAAWVGGIVLVALMFLTTADVAGRYFFNSPINGVFDLTHFAVLIMVFMSLAYCGWRGAHVAIDLLFNRFPPPVQRVALRLINLAGCALFLVIAWRTAVQSVDVRDFREASPLLTVPYWPFYWMVAFGCVLFAFVMAIRVFLPEPGTGDQS